MLDGKQIFFSDEAHFIFDGYVNKQNCPIWDPENPQVTEERPLHLEKVTVWCALRSEGVNGPYFFENDGCYRQLGSLWPYEKKYDLKNMWF